MQSLTAAEIVKATGGTLIKGKESTVISGVQTDSRDVKKGDLFVPLVDARDGHDFIDKAIESDAAAVIIHKDMDIAGDVCVIRVADTLKALGNIARFYKRKYNVPTVSVTGSVGKTTTKDIIHSALDADRKTIKTQKNFNNHIGVPKTVFTIEEDTETAVIEMGMNHFGEIDYLASIVEPDAAVITNIGMSHIENLGSQEGIFKAKMEITNRFDKSNTLIVNGDDKFLGTLKGTDKFNVITYGIDNSENDVKAKDIKSLGLDGISFTAVMDGKDYSVTVNIPGYHNVYNALAALCVSQVFGADINKAIGGIAHTTLTENRLEVEHYRDMTLVKDYYNASPDSIRAALSIMSYAKEKRIIAVLGDILEVGDYAYEAHYSLGEAVVKNGINILVTAGENAKHIAEGARDNGLENAVSFKTTDEAAEYVKGILKAGDAVLIKASHGMKFEKIYNAIKD